MAIDPYVVRRVGDRCRGLFTVREGIVAERYDAVVRLDEQVAKHMIAVRIGSEGTAKDSCHLQKTPRNEAGGLRSLVGLSVGRSIHQQHSEKKDQIQH